MDIDHKVIQKAKDNAETNMNRVITEEELHLLILGILHGRKLGIQEGMKLHRDKVKEGLETFHNNYKESRSQYERF